MKISIIISTYNRCESLRNILGSLVQQKDDGTLEYEIVVVDNNSKDKTEPVVREFSRMSRRLKYVFEGAQGISHARNAGIRSSEGLIIAFTDDDIILDEKWLSNIYDVSQEMQFDAIGGRVLPLYPTNTPSWIKNCRAILDGPIVCHDYGDVIKEYDQTMLPFVGANMIVKRDVINSIGGFNTDIGSGKGTMGEDTEFFRRIQAVGKRVYYCPHITVLHPVSRSRMTLKYIATWYMASGKYLVYRNREKERGLRRYFNIPTYLYPQLLKCAASLFFSVPMTKNFIQAWKRLFIRVGMAQAYRS